MWKLESKRNCAECVQFWQLSFGEKPVAVFTHEDMPILALANNVAATVRLNQGNGPLFTIVAP